LALLKKTPAQRRIQYKLAKELGYSPKQAKRLRDVRSTTLYRISQLPVPPLKERRRMGLLVLIVGLSLIALENNYQEIKNEAM
jgi:hypothetical protein